MSAGRVLPVDPDELARCVSCGLCLAHCPTFRVTGEEAFSPRGRIAAMRAVEAGAAVDASYVEILESCVVCRACETACPSSVPFGRLMEGARTQVSDRAVPWWQRIGYRVLEHPVLLAALTSAGVAASRCGPLPRRLAGRLGLPGDLPLRRARLRPTGGEVWLFTGCVMDAWQRPVHQATLAVLSAIGVGVALPGRKAACCGALHGHAGLHSDAVRLARRVMSAFPGDSPVLVDSAGCGAAMKEYGRLVGDAAARKFSARVFDVHEWIATHHGTDLPAPAPALPRQRIVLQDPCHLRHAQRAEAHVRTVLAPYGDLVELADDGRCCGAGGAFSVLRPQLAGSIRDAKVAVIEAAGADVVASPNPGCALWLASAGLRVRHPMEIVAESAGLASSGDGARRRPRALLRRVSPPKR